MLEKQGQPTNEQIRELWRWCGFKSLSNAEWNQNKHKYLRYIYPNGEKKSLLPHLDLNNLFKYAVPKLDNMRLSYSLVHAEYVAIAVNDSSAAESKVSDKNPALALFWVLYKVIQG